MLGRSRGLLKSSAAFDISVPAANLRELQEYCTRWLHEISSPTYCLPILTVSNPNQELHEICPLVPTGSVDLLCVQNMSAFLDILQDRH